MSKYTCYYCMEEFDADDLELVEAEHNGDMVVACAQCRGAA